MGDKASILLSKEENQRLNILIGKECKKAAVAVVQVYSAEPTRSWSQKWMKLCCGVLCLVLDTEKTKYFLRVYCLQTETVLWQQEFIRPTQYRAQRKRFHILHGNVFEPFLTLKQFLIGFNFADTAEAKSFYMTAAYIKINPNRKSSSKTKFASLFPLDKAPDNEVAENSESCLKKSTVITKADIGLPFDFRVESHVEWDPNRGFTFKNVNEELLLFLSKDGAEKDSSKASNTASSELKEEKSSSVQLLNSVPQIIIQNSESSRSFPVVPTQSPTFLTIQQKTVDKKKSLSKNKGHHVKFQIISPTEYSYIGVASITDDVQLLMKDSSFSYC